MAANKQDELMKAELMKALGKDHGGNKGATILMKLLDMAKTAENEKAWDPTVERVGDKIILPEGANIPDVIDALQNQYDFE